MSDKEGVFNSNFSLIADELVRQFEVEKEAINKLDTKAQFVLGLVGIVFGYLFTKSELLSLPCYIGGLLKYTYYFGLFLIFAAGLLAYLSYKGKNLQYGIDKEQLISKYREDGTRNFKQIIARAIYDANKSNKHVIDLKSGLFEWSLLALMLGVLLLTISQMFIVNI